MNNQNLNSYKFLSFLYIISLKFKSSQNYTNLSLCLISLQDPMVPPLLLVSPPEIFCTCEKNYNIEVFKI